MNSLIVFSFFTKNVSILGFKYYPSHSFCNLFLFVNIYLPRKC